MTTQAFQLGFGVTFEDLYSRDGLVKLDAAFVKELKDADVELYNRFVAARLQASKTCPPLEGGQPNAKHEAGGGIQSGSADDQEHPPTAHADGVRELPLQGGAEDNSAQVPRRLALQGGAEETDTLSEKDLSNLLIDVAPYLEDFIGTLFGIEKEVQALAAQHHELADIYLCKRIFVQRRAPKICKADEAETLDGEALAKELEAIFEEPLTEKSFATHVMQWVDGTKGTDIPGHEDKVELAGKYASWALHTDAGKKKHRIGVLFKKPNKLDFDNLVPLETEVVDGVTMLKSHPQHVRDRDGFKLTDEGGSLEIALDDANYCIYCHNQSKDSCSKGLKDKPDPETGKATFKTSPTRTLLAGCPLEEKISEMNMLKSRGYSIGALGVVTVDNPMCAATGHRICNDCMKACVYQKQDPVNIPRMETRTLQDVLDLPWGFEIYGLLTRWNPLNLASPIPGAESGYKVLVAGLGPAGFTLSHFLLNQGHTVVAVDGLKIEPLPAELSGVTPLGERVPFKPIKDIRSELFEALDERVLAGFGGVAEYGITVRWNKNYLKVLRLLLERRSHFAMYGGVRFGGTITYDKAFELGFDHVAMCLGAGKPTVVSMPNAMARGVRTASDFLMSLQLTGAAKEHSIANLQVRLPVVVIGGGLTGIDTATESLAYYPIQVEKFLQRYETLVAEQGEDVVRARWTPEETEIAEEFIAHARAIREEKKKDNPNIIGLLQSWGGATLAYRRTLQDAPSYRLNHEEVEKAMEEGIFFKQNVTPAGVRLDEHGHAKGLRVTYPRTDDEGHMITEETTLPAKTIFMGAGTNPNTVLNREDSEHFAMDQDGWYFQAVDEDGELVTPEKNISKPETPHVLMSKNEDGRFISFFGDLHPTYVGNVVKAMGSAKQGAPVVDRVLRKLEPSFHHKTLTSPSRGGVDTQVSGGGDYSKEFTPHDSANASSAPPQGGSDVSSFFAHLNNQLIARVEKVIRLTPTIVEVIVKAPLAAERFEPGQFYRFQNYESLAPKAPDGTTLAMEGLALTGAWVDKEQGLMSTIVLEMGGSSNLCAYLKEGEPVVCMGPTGAPTEIEPNETVMLVGGGLGNAVLFSIGRAFRNAGSKVLYFAGYKQLQDRYKVEEIEKAADVIVWCCDEGEFPAERPQDKTFHGNIVEAMRAYGAGELGDTPIKTQNVDRIITIGSDRMMAAVKQARFTVLKDLLKEDHQAIGSINSPMQCMMKEICAQCLQRHIDPKTGERYYVYSCFNQDQVLDHVDFPHLNERLQQNGVQEKLTALWIDRSLKQMGLEEEAVAA